MDYTYLDKYTTKCTRILPPTQPEKLTNSHRILKLTDAATVSVEITPHFKDTNAIQHQLELTIPFMGTKFYLTVNVFEYLTMDQAVRDGSCLDGVPTYITITQVVSGRQSNSKGNNKRLPGTIKACGSIPFSRPNFGKALKFGVMSDLSSFMEDILSQQ